MSDRLIRSAVSAALVLAVNGCVSPHRLSASCTAPSRSTWTNTRSVGRIEGEIRDLEHKTPIGNLEIRVVDLDLRQRTDGQGLFRFDAVPEGRHVLVTEGSVYQARSDTLVLPVEGGASGRLELTTRRDVLKRCPIYRP